MMSFAQQNIYDNLVKIAEENGCKVVSLVYESSNISMEFRCPKGHTRITSTKKFRNNPLGCIVCSGKSSIESEKDFLVNIEKIGGKVIGKYKNISTKVECECSNGHRCFPTPNNIQRGQGICKKCANNCSEEAERKFIENVEKIGGKIIGPYKGAHIPVETICSNGHICFSTPSHIRQGGGMCNKCVNHCSEDAEKRFTVAINGLGGKIVGKYINTNTRIECICPNNHTCYPVPSKIQSGRGMCRKCAGNCPIEAEKNFVDNVNKLGGKFIGKYTSTHKSVECICINGHVCFPRPGNIRRGQGICKICVQDQIESKGEKYTSKALDKLGITYTKQYKHPRLPKLRFDFQFDYENKLFLVEFDGVQHQKYQKHFHRPTEKFEKQRQRDLMKNYLVKNVPDCVLIRLDHEWLKMDDPVESISEYIWEKMGEPAGSVVAENLLYMWIYDEPTQESINRYFVL